MKQYNTEQLPYSLAFTAPGMIKTVGDSATFVKPEKPLYGIDKFAFTMMSRQTGIPVSVIKSKTRKRPIVDARQMCLYLIYIFSKITLTDIGFIVLQDHASVLHSFKVVKNLSESDAEFNASRMRYIEICSESNYHLNNGRKEHYQYGYNRD